MSLDVLREVLALKERRAALLEEITQIDAVLGRLACVLAGRPVDLTHTPTIASAAVPPLGPIEGIPPPFEAHARAIVESLRLAGRPLSPAQLVTATTLNREAVRLAVRALERAGYVTTTGVATNRQVHLC